jgi:hypothetical protein
MRALHDLGLVDPALHRQAHVSHVIADPVAASEI